MRALVAALALAGCSAEGGGPEAAFALPDRRLEGTSWTIATLDGEPVGRVPGADRSPGLTFKAGYATWTVGCNDFDARYRVEADRLQLRPLHGTLIGGCEALERPFEVALTTAPMPLEITDGRLSLRTPEGPLELRRVKYRAVGPR